MRLHLSVYKKVRVILIRGPAEGGDGDSPFGPQPHAHMRTPTLLDTPLSLLHL